MCESPKGELLDVVVSVSTSKGVETLGCKTKNGCSVLVCFETSKFTFSGFS
eukprot:UN06316